MQSNKQSISAHGTTHIEGKEFTYTWYIHNFNSLCIDAVNLESPKFSTDDNKDILWYLEMHSYETCKDYLSIILSMHDSKNNSTKRVHLTISIVDYKGDEQAIVQSSFIPKFGDINGRKFLEFVEKNYVKNTKNGLLLNGMLTIKCKMFFFDKFVSVPQSIYVQKSKCNCNLTTLFETKKLSDATLVVGTEKFEIHKCILAARSKVFSAMFEHDMKENRDNIVNIDDIEPQAIQEMLEFLYTGKTEGFQDTSSLLIAADKYGIDDLKSICEDRLINDVSGANVGKILILADTYKSDLLKTRAIQFILMHPNEINLEQFKTDIESHSPLLSDMLRGLV